MFKEIKATEIKENGIDLLANQWGLVTAGTEAGYNTMTVSWGAIGELWGRDCATIYIRPQRYTREFIDSNDYFTLSFYPPELKSVHSVCGSKSGRDCNKTEATGLTPVFDREAPYFDEAKLVLVCKKMAVSKMEPTQFLDDTIDSKWYPEKDYHYVYYGEIINTLVKE